MVYSAELRVIPALTELIQIVTLGPLKHLVALAVNLDRADGCWHDERALNKPASVRSSSVLGGNLVGQLALHRVVITLFELWQFLHSRFITFI